MSARIVDTRAERFSLSTSSGAITNRTDAGEHIRRVVARAAASSTEKPVAVELGTLGGLRTSAHVDVTGGQVRLDVHDIGESITYSMRDWSAADPSTVSTRIERRIQRVPSEIDAAATDIAATERELNAAVGRVGAPFPGREALIELRCRQTSIETTLQARAGDAPTSTPASSPTTGNTITPAAARRGPGLA